MSLGLVEKSEDKQAQVEGMSFPIKLDAGTDVISMNSTDMTFFNIKMARISYILIWLVRFMGILHLK